jgi:hypothetical protein
MARAAKRKTGKAKRKAAPAKRRAKPSARKGGGNAPAPRASAEPVISRDIVEELLVHSARSDEADRLSDKALSQIAAGAGLEAAKLLEAHRLLCDEADASGVTTVFRVVELWEPDD